MKYLYVLVSNSNDYYSEQAFISILSLKLHTPNCFVVLLTEQNTSKYLRQCFDELITLIDECKVVNLDDKYSNMEKSRILKTTMRQHINGDFLFIDCDTVICDDLSDIEICNYNMACVLDNHMVVSKHWRKDIIKKNAVKCGFNESLSFDYHFNSGVIYCKDNQYTRAFFEVWHSLWLNTHDKGIHQDQISLHQANVVYDGFITEIGGQWNCQLVNGGVRFLSDAKIIHYFSSFNPCYGNPFLIDNTDILKRIRKERSLFPELELWIQNPKKAISNDSTLLGNAIPKKVLYDSLLASLIWLYMHNKRIYNCMNFICKGLASFAKKIKIIN